MTERKHGFTFGGCDFSPWLECSFTRPIAPKTKVSETEVGGADGTRLDSVRLEPMDIKVTAKLRRTREPIAEVRHMLAARLVSREPMPLTLPDDPGRYHLAVISGSSDLSRLWERGEAELTFRCHDPVAYDARVRSRALAADKASTVAIGGTYRTRPTLRLAASATAVSVDWGDGSVTALDGSVAKGSAIVIDCEARATTVNGASWPVTLASDYPAMEPGTHEITVTGAAGTIEWRERWL